MERRYPSSFLRRGALTGRDQHARECGFAGPFRRGDATLPQRAPTPPGKSAAVSDFNRGFGSAELLPGEAPRSSQGRVWSFHLCRGGSPSPAASSARPNARALGKYRSRAHALQEILHPSEARCRRESWVVRAGRPQHIKLWALTRTWARGRALSCSASSRRPACSGEPQLLSRSAGTRRMRARQHSLRRPCSVRRMQKCTLRAHIAPVVLLLAAGPSTWQASPAPCVPWRAPQTLEPRCGRIRRRKAQGTQGTPARISALLAALQERERRTPRCQWRRPTAPGTGVTRPISPCQPSRRSSSCVCHRRCSPEAWTVRERALSPGLWRQGHPSAAGGALSEASGHLASQCAIAARRRASGATRTSGEPSEGRNRGNSPRKNAPRSSKLPSSRTPGEEVGGSLLVAQG